MFIFFSEVVPNDILIIIRIIQISSKLLRCWHEGLLGDLLLLLLLFGVSIPINVLEAEGLIQVPLG